MPRNLQRYYGGGDLHFVTFSCYQRLPLLNRPCRRDLFLRALEKIRQDYRLLVAGYVVMPEHVHLLVGEPQTGTLSTALKALKQSVARRVLRRWRGNGKQSDLFEAAPPRFWQRRFYDFNVFSERKRIEKLRYIHRNPVTRGLVPIPEMWLWSSYRNYAYGEGGPVVINHHFPQELRLKQRASASFPHVHARVGHPLL